MIRVLAPLTALLALPVAAQAMDCRIVFSEPRPGAPVEISGIVRDAPASPVRYSLMVQVKSPAGTSLSRQSGAADGPFPDTSPPLGRIVLGFPPGATVIAQMEVESGTFSTACAARRSFPETPPAAEGEAGKDEEIEL
jgi:hypothetical protein